MRAMLKTILPIAVCFLLFHVSCVHGSSAPKKSFLYPDIYQEDHADPRSSRYVSRTISYWKNYKYVGAASLGNSVIDSAILYLIYPTDEHFNVAKGLCDQALNNKDIKSYRDLEIATQMFGLSILYDFEKSDPRDALFLKWVREKLLYFTKSQYEYALNVKGNYWPNSYWHNHSWINYTALLAASMALSDENAEARVWLDFSKGKLSNILYGLSSDGSDHEGIDYSVYGNQWLVRGASLVEKYDREIFRKCHYLKNYHAYFQGMRVSSNNFTMFDLGDSYRELGVNPAEFFLKLSREYKDEFYPCLYSEFATRYKIPPALFSLAYGLEAPAAAEDCKVDNVYFTQDLGIFTEKDPASGSAFLFKSGVPGGKYATEKLNDGSVPGAVLTRAHNHPDQNTFMIYDPSGFLISDTGYTYKKLTRDHNTLLVNGIGQMGEGGQWFKDADIEKRKISEKAGLLSDNIYQSDSLTVVSSEAAEFYPQAAGLTSYDRTVVWIKSLGFFVADDIRTQTPSKLEFSFHSDFNIVLENPRSAKFIKNGKTLGRFVALYPADSSVTADEGHVIAHGSGKDTPRGYFIDLRCSMKTGHQVLLGFIALGPNRDAANVHEYDDKFIIEVPFDNSKVTIIYRKSEVNEFTYESYRSDAKVLVIDAREANHEQAIHVYRGSYFKASDQDYLSGGVRQSRVILVPSESN